MIDDRPDGRDRRLVSTILILGAIALFFIVLGQLASFLSFFADILLTFFLAWLLAFIISPVVTRIIAAIPKLPRVLATVIVYTAVVLVLVTIIVVVAGALTTSISEFLASIPQIQRDLPAIVAPWQAWLDSIGLGQVDLVTQLSSILDNLDEVAGVLVQPLQQIAVASLSVLGTMLIVFFLSIYMVDRPRPDHGLPVPAGPAVLCRGGAAPADLRLPLVRRLPPRPGAPGHHLLRRGAGDQRRHGPAAHRPDVASRRAL